jgi:hypothetical protein
LQFQEQKVKLRKKKEAEEARKAMLRKLEEEKHPEL